MDAHSFAPEAGIPLELAPGLQLILAPNPSPMTYLGTNSYILGTSRLAIIDPGPNDPQHLAALMAAIDNRPVSHILVTHSHLDHSPLARPLADETGAPVLAFGPSHAGRSNIMKSLAQDDLIAGGEGIDLAFSPDVLLMDGEKITGPEFELTARHTPGHIGNHLCFVWGDNIFTGDHIMGWSTSLVSPPDGDLTQFMQSCARLADIPAQTYFPGHGAPVVNPQKRLQDLVAHRKMREQQILSKLEAGENEVATLTRAIYTDIAPGLRSAAERNVLAHLIDLVSRGLATAHPQLSRQARFSFRSQ
ncbi:MBL fold metallo-hydrolase [Yoonia sediminilitoris]|uniref:Glyoxylase-like metal-dependent hydrolase (Beta-lactamase superfamily II) n=1 Tax=Yoonia sediminilitoris TaxID=1286148 RepID=A0A2T6KRX7_9RHOB|nr:MBL fold metallo-hydrolase [Yoonia sediminilitoris]PUB19275.1 glyoxylase-like metal-dependent hydrolase (beta-lactamase superfamily II) [Yoonia sediminilitoris]RCW99443.1 glyoxylase-like metal-dependent hydrolase (beta-lactamase superfamily II) [Yoonia sediminilitoris]